jgi:endonuclease YncB( thermonuclease family)
MNLLSNEINNSLSFTFSYNLQLFINSNKLPKSFEGNVVAIKDGDTYKVMLEDKENTIRLERIACP